MQKTNKKRILMVLMIPLFSLLLLSCQNNVDEESSELEGYNTSIESVINESNYIQKVENVLTDDEEDLLTDNSNDFQTENTVNVLLNDDQTVITNTIDETNIYMENGNLIVESTKRFTLVVTGTLHGSIIVYKTDGKFQLVLDGVDITSNSGPAINIHSETRSFLVINPGTTNNIIDGTEHPEMSDGSNTDGAIFSEEQLIISGGGTLNITARYQHAIVSDDYIKVLSGKINVLQASSDGLHANDYIVIDGGEINIQANSDGIECEKGYVVINGGKITINAINDGIKTSYDEANIAIQSFIEIHNGIIDIIAQKEGLKSKSDIILFGGAMTVNTIDDALSADGEILINDGIFYFHSEEKQALDGDSAVIIFGGISLLFSDGDSATIESDDGFIAINGGRVIASGPVDMESSQFTQGYITYNDIQENKIYNLNDEALFITIAFIQEYNYLHISDSNMVKDSRVDIYTNGTIVGDNLYGYYLTGTYKDGTLIDNVVVK